MTRCTWCGADLTVAICENCAEADVAVDVGARAMPQLVEFKSCCLLSAPEAMFKSRRGAGLEENKINPKS